MFVSQAAPNVSELGVLYFSVFFGSLDISYEPAPDNRVLVSFCAASSAGRLPGFGPIDERGYRRYSRPEGKSGGHGVGWSEIPPYSFDLPASFEEVAVSIADLGMTHPHGEGLRCESSNKPSVFA